MTRRYPLLVALGCIAIASPVLAIDTFSTVDRLHEGGVDRLQALTIVTVIDEFSTELNAKIDAVETRLNAKIDAVETRLNAKIDAVEIRLDAVEDRLNAKIDSQIQGLEQSVLMWVAIIVGTATAILSTIMIIFSQSIVKAIYAQRQNGSPLPRSRYSEGDHGDALLLDPVSRRMEHPTPLQPTEVHESAPPRYDGDPEG